MGLVCQPASGHRSRIKYLPLPSLTGSARRNHEMIQLDSITDPSDKAELITALSALGRSDSVRISEEESLRILHLKENFRLSPSLAASREYCHRFTDACQRNRREKVWLSRAAYSVKMPHECHPLCTRSPCPGDTMHGFLRQLRVHASRVAVTTQTPLLHRYGLHKAKHGVTVNIHCFGMHQLFDRFTFRTLTIKPR